MAIAPAYIDPPNPPLVPYGIFDVSMGPVPFPRSEIENYGLIYTPDDCVSDTFLYGIQCPAVSGSKTFTGVDTPVTGAPFGVIATWNCGSIGFSLEEAETRVRTRLSLREQMAVERRIWQGQLGGGSVLGNITGLFRGATSLGTAGCVTEATEMLEQALATNGVLGGIIHARWGMSAHFSNSHLTERGPGRLRSTYLGTPIVFGQGYDGTGPNGEVTTTDDEYVYASGRVLIWRSEPVVPPPAQTFNTTTNQQYLLAERTYAVAVECGVWAVKVTRNCTTAT